MHLQSELQRLLQRHGEIERAMRRPGGIRITVERELQVIRERLKKFPAALQTVQSWPVRSDRAAEAPLGRMTDSPQPSRQE